MKFETLLSIVADEPVFSSGLLLSGEGTARQMRLQLSRWTKAGRLLQLRRGLYVPARPWRKVEPHPFLVANRLHRGSFVSLQSALAWYGLIPEHVPVVTSVGPGRPETIHTPLGSFLFSHLSERMRFGYSRTEVAPRQFAFIASPEKALLDLIYLTPGADSPEYLAELRLQNLPVIDRSKLEALARRSGKPRLIRAAENTGILFSADRGDDL